MSKDKILKTKEKKLEGKNWLNAFSYPDISETKENKVDFNLIKTLEEFYCEEEKTSAKSVENVDLHPFDYKF